MVHQNFFFRLKNNFEQKKGIRDKKCKKKLGGIARIAEELGREKCFVFFSYKMPIKSLSWMYAIVVL